MNAKKPKGPWAGKKKKVSLTKYNQSDIAKPFNDKSVNQNWSTADFWEEG